MTAIGVDRPGGPNTSGEDVPGQMVGIVQRARLHPPVDHIVPAARSGVVRRQRLVQERPPDKGNRTLDA